METPKFSVCLIGRNEGKTIPRLVKGLEEFTKRGGEIILVDTGSTDNTAKVAKELGVFVTEVGNKFLITIGEATAKEINKRFIVDGEEGVVKPGDKLFDFASARNYAASLCKNDMIAMPDCDEVYTKLDIDKINEAIDRGINQLEYEFVYSHDEMGNPSLQFRHAKFYDRMDMKWVGIVHEVLKCDDWANLKKEYLTEDVIKLEHFQNPETNRDKYLTGLAYDCYENSNNDRNSHYFARELMYKGRYKSAIKEFERHIAMNKRPTERAQSMIYIGDCYKYLGIPERGLCWYTNSLDVEPNRREPFLALARHYYDQGNHRLCCAYAKAALELPGVNYYSNYAPNYKEIPHELLYRAYWYLGDKQKSKEHYDIAYAYNPNKEKYIADRKFYYE